MRISIHQPAYLPWMGYFDKIAQADLFVYLDHVQFQKNSFQNRNKVKAANGPVWLTVPVLTKGGLFETPLSQLEIDNKQLWQKKHFRTLQQSYAKAPFSRRLSDIQEFYETNSSFLSSFCFEMMKVFMQELGIRTPLVRSSEIAGVQHHSKSDLILHICKELKADFYLSGAMGKDYLDLQSFEENDIAVEFQSYRHPIYPQVGKPDDEFVPYMGIIDLLCNVAAPEQYFLRSALSNVRDFQAHL